MTLTVASAHLSDEAFLSAFSTCELPLSMFRHGDHLRLAWLQLHRHPLETASRVVREGIREYARHHGVPHIFHETMTAAWVSLLATHNEPSFAAFVGANEHRLHSGFLHTFWTPEALGSEVAKRNWLPPDRASLPTM